MAFRWSDYSVEDVSKWLHSKGFGVYADAFEDSEIDAEILWTLTEDDMMKKMSIPFGKSRKIFMTIKEEESSLFGKKIQSQAKNGPKRTNNC